MTNISPSRTYFLFGMEIVKAPTLLSNYEDSIYIGKILKTYMAIGEHIKHLNTMYD